MKLNVFCIPEGELANLKNRLRSNQLKVIKIVEQDGWQGSFYYSSDPKPGPIEWVETYKTFFDEMELPYNLNYYAVYIFTKGSKCYALSYGKAHFYLRPFCDYDFGIELAKRIANRLDIKQTASKRFQGKKKKDIKSYAANTRLEVESGESMDYIQASVINDKVETFGRVGKFGSSALLNPDMKPEVIGSFLTKLTAQMTQPALFKLPRTTLVTDEAEISKYNQLLIKELLSPIGTTEFTHNSYDLYGVDFVFSNTGSFKIWCPKYADLLLDDLSMRDLKEYIMQNSVAPEDVLGIRITHYQDDQAKYTQSVKQAVDFIVDDERVILSEGRWMRFNQDYLDFLDNYLRGVVIEEVEHEFAQIAETEPDFNVSQAIKDAGYDVADKDFSIFRTRSSTPLEAWDLKKGSRVYAVKFGSAQKLGYVCDQASAVLELIRNRADVKKIPDFKEYCLWLGYRSQTPLASISDTGSIILKQKIEAWARKARDLGIEPIIKISRKIKPGIDTSS